MKKTDLIKLIFAICAFVVVVAIIITVAGRVSLTKEIVKLKIGVMPIGDCLTIFVAQEKGFFKEEGLEVEFVSMSGGARIAPAVESGELDIGFSNMVSIIIAYEAGLDFKFLVPGAFKGPRSADLFQLLVRSNSAIREVGDIEGKTVAINTYNNIMELALKAWADYHNVDYNKLNVVEVPFPQMESALETEEIDVAFTVEPFGTLALTSGVAKVFDKTPYDALADQLMISSWFAKQSWINENQEKIAAFTRAMNKANKYSVEYPAELLGIMVKYSRSEEDVLRLATFTTFVERAEKSDLQVMVDLSAKYGYISERFDVKEIVADGFNLK